MSGKCEICARHHHFLPRSNPVWAKGTHALRTISYARFISRFYRANAFSRSRSGLVSLAGQPLSLSARRTHLHSVSAEQPQFVTFDSIVAHGKPCSCCCSTTMRTAHPRTSAEIFVAFPLLHPLK